MKQLLLKFSFMLCVVAIGGFNNLYAQVASVEGNNFEFPYVKMDRSSDNVYFESGAIIPEKIDMTSNEAIDYSNSEVINNGVLRVVQFSKLPNIDEKEIMKTEGITLLDYIPNKAFISHIAVGVSYKDLSKWNINAISNYNSAQKLDKYISTSQFPDFVINGSKRRLVLSTFEFIDLSQFQSEISSVQEVEIIQPLNGLNALEVYVEESDINKIAQINSVKFIEIGHTEGEPENYTARTLHRSNYINTGIPGGRKYDGTGVTVMMQDDGDIGPHIDYHGRVDQSLANFTGSNGDHGDHVAGTFMGSGNLNPIHQGMAPGVFGYIAGNLNSNYNFVSTLINNANLSITTKSYSNGCNAGYTSLTEQLDSQVYVYNNLIHVFSAGNSNGANCGYGAGSQWGNITGGHKVGKNTMTVANLNATDQISNSSSRGPAADGRIKPDISAKGSSVISPVSGYNYANFSGTSMACPGVTGTLAQLYHAYRDLNGGSEPNSGLMKAIVLNTAEDLGNAGPDFIFGWGRINAKEAFESIQNVQYMDSTIADGDSVIHTLNIPSNVTRAKIMLYWQDPAASVAATFDLVNDLDLRVNDPGALEHLPLVLNPAPNATTLNMPAMPGTDVLNNMEQVVIDAPAAGNYDIKVKGSMVPAGPQEYFIVYQYEYDEVSITYPVGGESIEPGSQETIRWDAFGPAGSFNLEYSLDSGQNWTSISSGVSSGLRHFVWNVPNGISTNKALVRVSKGGNTSTSEAPFTIMGVPTGVTVTASCIDSAQLSWNPVAGADAYIVRKLGSVYMDSVEYTTGTSVYIDGVSSTDPDVWLSVQAVNLNTAGTKITGYGRRSTSLRKATGVFSCPSLPPIAQFTADTAGICVGSAVKFENTSFNAVGNYVWTFTPNTVNFVNGTTVNSAEPEVEFLNNVSYTVELQANQPGGTSTETKTNYINPIIPDANLNEDFEAGFTLPVQWTIDSANGDEHWKFVSLLRGPGGPQTKAALFDRFAESAINEEEGLVSKPVDLSNFTSPTLIFDIACTDIQSVSLSQAGKLRIDVSDDCGASYQNGLYLKSSIDLITAGYDNQFWRPMSAGDWRKDTLDLSAFAGSSIKVRFMNISGRFDNSLYIDNVEIFDAAVSGLDKIAGGDIRVFPNPTSGTFTINSEKYRDEEVSIYIIDSRGRVIKEEKVQAGTSGLGCQISLEGLNSGLYTVKVMSDNNFSIHKVSYLNN